jgi:hypothetical protein
MATGRAGFSMFSATLGRSRDGRVKLVFRCGSQTGCALEQIWGTDGVGRMVPVPRLKAAELERLAVVYADRSAPPAEQ